MTMITRFGTATAAALVAALALSIDSAPTLAQDQAAPCSWGSDNVCFQERICTEHGFTFSLWPFQFGWTNCLNWIERILYYMENPTDDNTPGSTPDDPGTPPGGD